MVGGLICSGIAGLVGGVVCLVLSCLVLAGWLWLDDWVIQGGLLYSLCCLLSGWANR
jgi:hypothetical protein